MGLNDDSKKRLLAYAKKGYCYNLIKNRNVSVIKDALGNAETNEVVYIGTDLPDEYSHSEYTHILKGTNEKAKANAAQGLPELIITATNMEHTDNSKAKHKKDAKYGRYKYESRFALPVFASNGEVERNNVFHVAMILRHDKDGKKYLYDIMNIKKKRVTFSSPMTLLSKKPISWLL